MSFIDMLTVTRSGVFLDPFQVRGDSGKNAWRIEIGTAFTPANHPNNVGYSSTISRIEPLVVGTTTIT
jgi:hypothetical protein